MENSPDGKTYLQFMDGNNCDPLLVDGAPWNHAIGEAGLVSPGEHVVGCNGEICFTVPAGTTFEFDYWGP